MSTKNDETKFTSAYEDNIDFKSFDEKDGTSCRNSRFSLLRELATESAPNVTDIKNAASVKELLSVNTSDSSSSSSTVSIASVAIPQPKKSSLKSFLKKNTETYEPQSPLDIKINSEQISNNGLLSSLDQSKFTSKKTDDNLPKNDKKSSSVDVSSAPEVKKSSKQFSFLFKSTLASEFRGKKTDSLQDLYKRLLQE